MLTTSTPAVPVLQAVLPLQCRCTGGGLDRTTAADLVADFCQTPEGIIARLSVVLADHANPSMHGPLVLWFRPEELTALLLTVAELEELQAECAP